MKKIYNKIVFISMFLAVAVFCGFADIGAEDQPQKKVMNFIAVMDLRCGKEIEKEQCSALTEVLIGELAKIKKYAVIDRANRDKILSEAGFQQTACVDESCTIEMGRQLGVGKLVVGSVTKLGQTYLINLQLLNVETASVEIASDEECKCDLDGVIGAVRSAGRKLMGEAPASPPASTSPSAPPSSYPTVFDATRAGDLKAVQYFLDNNPGLINTNDPQTGYPLLVLSLVGGRRDIFHFLIDRGADVNAKGGKGGVNFTALHLAVMGCSYGDTYSIVELLINKGANVNEGAGVLGKPLKMAKKCSDTRIYNLLKQHSAN